MGTEHPSIMSATETLRLASPLLFHAIHAALLSQFIAATFETEVDINKKQTRHQTRHHWEAFSVKRAKHAI
eukprot:scaffold3227_cov239-Pinguiococcus_pyrenoidosus.AAC.1